MLCVLGETCTNVLYNKEEHASSFTPQLQIKVSVKLNLNALNSSASKFCFMSSTSFRTLVERGPGAAVIRHVQPSASSLELYSSLAGLDEFNTAEFSVFPL